MKIGRAHLPFLNSPEEARAMYAGGRANNVARRYARFWVAVLGRGLLPGPGVVLEVPGRQSGAPRTFPLVEARLDHRRYLVSMLGEDCNWVRNVRAADGAVRLRHGPWKPFNSSRYRSGSGRPYSSATSSGRRAFAPTSRSTTALSSARSRRSRTATPCSESQPRDRPPSRAHHSNSDP